MRKAFQVVGVVLALQGISGAIDHLAVQPIMGIFLNAVNRLVIPRLGFLTGYELYANLTLALFGIAVFVAATRINSS
ncbi:hypothetical protein C1I98_28795 [Spongiactinospora gelatinilytica]|uniref:Uncharacterized protein n=1 Tax=Spongiactinospora gelatinilytica TaxID=2666298 RepID=A0A2W2FCZ3_9ACTN|nr:hypothetical protein [Spongiactinospora gelatinilytica]PZG33512.1 hypothetical protein C1I98_28795 [Spongiactinospora gelatinilytica]